MTVERTGVRPLPWQVGLAVAVASVLLDQISKSWMLVALAPYRSIAVTPFFNLTLGFNTGVSFGMFAGGGATGRWMLTVFAVAMIGILGTWLARAASRVEAAALGAMIGGALGNIIDRVRRGAVTDFLDFHAAGWHWPSFNLADAAIFLGVLVLLAKSLPSKVTS